MASSSGVNSSASIPSRLRDGHQLIRLAVRLRVACADHPSHRVPDQYEPKAAMTLFGARDDGVIRKSATSL